MTIHEAAVEAWFRAHDAYHQASAAYNARLKLVRAERERDNWSMTTDREYHALTEAQRQALHADEGLYQHLRLNGELNQTGGKDGA